MNVYDYNSGTKIESSARVSEALIGASADDPTGAVAAWRDPSGVWQYVSQADETHYRDNLKRDVQTIYLG